MNQAVENPVLKYTLDPKQVIEDHILLEQIREKQEELDLFLKEHITKEESRFAKVEKYLMVMAAAMVLQATGMDISTIVSIVSKLAGLA